MAVNVGDHIEFQEDDYIAEGYVIGIRDEETFVVQWYDSMRTIVGYDSQYLLRINGEPVSHE